VLAGSISDLRMDVAIFDELYALVELEIARKETRMRYQ